MHVKPTSLEEPRGAEPLAGGEADEGGCSAASPRRPDGESRLRVTPCAAAAMLGDGRAVVWIGPLRRVVEGRFAPLVPKLVERFRSGAIVSAALAAVAAEEGCTRAEASRVLAELWELGVVDEDEEEGEPGDESASGAPELAAQRRYLSLFTSRPRRAVASLAAASVEVLAPPELSARLARLLGESGIGAVDVRPWPPAGVDASRPPGAAAAVLVARSLEDDWVLPCNDALVAAGRPFLAATLAGGVARLGPAVVPRESACLRCVFAAESRLRRPLPEGVRLPAAPDAVAPVALLDLVAALLVLEVVKSITGRFVPALANRRLAIEPATLSVEPETVFKLPRCPACGRTESRAEVEPFDVTAANAPRRED